MKKSLVAYFSATGVTAKAAAQIADQIGADLHEIKPAVPYTADDLDWRNKQSRSTLEMTDPASRPELAPTDLDVTPYTHIYVGFPIWWGVAPHAVNAFLEKYDLAGKTVIPFATSGGSGMGKSGEILAASAPGATVLEGRRIGGKMDIEALNVWESEND